MKKYKNQLKKFTILRKKDYFEIDGSKNYG